MARNKTEPIRRSGLPLKLAKEWSFDEAQRLGPEGGFAEVFEGTSDDGSSVAVKRIKRVTAGLATGEVRVARALMTRGATHVIPILDAGKDEASGHHFIVMPKADESLQERLDREGPMLGA